MSFDLLQGWKLRPYQEPFWDYMANGGRRAALCWHRRAGKDDVMMRNNTFAAFERVGNYWYMLPEYAQCRKAIWDAVNPHTGRKRIDEAFPKEIRANTLVQEMKIIFMNGSTWQLMGSDNYDALVGSPPVGLTYSEYALSNPNSWGYLRPIVLENKGFAIFNSTPRGKNHFYKLMKLAESSDEWFSQTLTADESGVFTPEQLEAELQELISEHDETYGRALWLQEYFCSFDAAMPGAIWGEAMARARANGQIRPVPVEKDFPVHTAWDLGRRDQTAVWFFQVVGEEIHVIDYYEASFKEIPDLCQTLVDKKKERDLTYGTHWLPHDARPKRMGMGGKSILQQFEDEFKGRDLGKIDITPHLSTEDGIQAGRATIRRSWFDELYCSKGIERLQAYRRKYDEELKTYSQTAIHDENSHGADAWRYLSLVWRVARERAPGVPSLEQQLIANCPTVINFGQMKRQHLQKMKAKRNEY